MTDCRKEEYFGSKREHVSESVMAGFVKKCPCLRPPTEEIHVLDYRHNSLSDLPTEVFNVERTLEELYVDNNQLRDLPRELFYCHGLHKLSLSDNEITRIPAAIGSLINLDELDISKNGIIDLPDNIKACKHLKSLEASINPLGKIPDGMTQLLNLRELYLNDTFLDYLPGNFGRLSKLKILEIRENHLKTLPKSFSRLVELERLDVGHNSLTELPEAVGGLVNLLELWCDQNKIEKISSAMGNLKQLIFMDASKNRLETLPTTIEGCISLADLYLTCNNIKSLPDSIGQLVNLTTLKVDDNMIVNLPASIGNLSALSELNISTNDLMEIPSTIGLLRNLRTMYADENYLELIPPEIGSCNGITVLSLRSNRLKYIPDEIGRIPHLRVLNLSDNQLKHLPFSIVKLKELQALWLTENQTRPLVQLQSDKDPLTGRKILTCYLFPQRTEKNEESLNDSSSFHASAWEEERLKRQQIHFAVSEDEEVDGKLSRCPTPYPKEMKEKMRHMKNLATLQQISVSGHENRGFEKDDKKNMKELSREPSIRTSGSISDSGSKSTENLSSHRMVNNLSGSISNVHIGSETGSELGHRKYSDDLTVNSSTTPLLKIHHSTPSSHDKLSSNQGLLSIVTSQSSNNQSAINQHVYSQRHLMYDTPSVKSYPKTREYDSDTGYRSDQEILRYRHLQNMMLSPKNINTGSDRVPFHQHYNPQLVRHQKDGYSSDIEGYRVLHRDAPSGSSLRGSLVGQGSSYRQSPNTTFHNHNYHSGAQKALRGDEFYSSDKAAPSGRTCLADISVPLTVSASFQEKMLDQSTPNGSGAPPNFSHLPDPRKDWHWNIPPNRQQEDHYAVLERKGHSSPHKIDSNMGSQSNLSDKYRPSAPPPYQPTPPYRTSAGSRQQPPPPPYQLESSKISKASPRTSIKHSTRNPYDTFGSEPVQPLQHSTPIYDHSNPYNHNIIINNNGVNSSMISKTDSRTPILNKRCNPRISSMQQSRAGDNSDSCHSGFDSPRGSTSSHSEVESPGLKNPRYNPQHLQNKDSFPGPSHSPCTAGGSHYDDVAIFKNTEPCSHVSSSTDSGYGHVYEKVDALMQPSGFANASNSKLSSPRHSYRPNSADERSSYTPSASDFSSPPPSREITPSRGVEAVYQQQKQQQHLQKENNWYKHEQTNVVEINITKNPGLGFSIAGGIGSYGNPFKPDDMGIFVTKVQSEGPAMNHLFKGDKILKVNDTDFTCIEHDRAVAVLKNSNPVCMLVKRK